MSVEQIHGPIFLIVLGLTIAMIYGPWQWYCVDRARQKLFEVRARIFNLAALGQLSFESDEYKLMRDNINKRLRFAHRVCWQQMLTIAWTYPNLPAESELTRQIRSIEDPELRKILEKEARKARLAMAELIIFRSPFLLAVASISVLCLCIRPLRIQAEFHRQGWQSSTGERIAVEAENVGPLLDGRQPKAA